VRSLRFAVAFDALLHLLVDLPQPHVAGAFQFARIGSRTEIGIVCVPDESDLILIQMRRCSKQADVDR
jgi:hypothetical protein